MRARGRPAHADNPLAQDDDAIGRAVYQLALWGATRPAAESAVAKAAGIRWPDRRLGSAGVRRIYSRWLASQIASGGKYGGGFGPMPSNFKAATRIEFRPTGKYSDLAKQLLDGTFSDPRCDETDPFGYMPPNIVTSESLKSGSLTAKAERQFRQFPMLASMRKYYEARDAQPRRLRGRPRKNPKVG